MQFGSSTAAHRLGHSPLDRLLGRVRHGGLVAHRL
jgi:hypothetical protein